MGVMEGRDSKHIRARFKDIYQPALLANWKIWPAAQVRRFTSHIWTWLINRAIVYQFLVYALTLPCSISTNVRRILDSLPVPPHF